MRPVYGYDDCFPTVDPCVFPEGEQFAIPDHGELCWMKWRVVAKGTKLTCEVSSRHLPVLFNRTLVFGDTSIDWLFEIRNEGDVPLPCLHVMHPLMPLNQVTGLFLPDFEFVFDEINGAELDGNDPKQFAQRLLNRPSGSVDMFLLRGIGEGRFEIAFREGPRLEVNFPIKLFPTIGIWWNRGGYPDEESCRRMECAVEPIPGTTSSLTMSHKDGVNLRVQPRQSLRWTVTWEIG
jgi:hypothetical protein